MIYCYNCYSVCNEGHSIISEYDFDNNRVQSFYEKVLLMKPCCYFQGYTGNDLVEIEDINDIFYSKNFCCNISNNEIHKLLMVLIGIIKPNNPNIYNIVPFKDLLFTKDPSHLNKLHDLIKTDELTINDLDNFSNEFSSQSLIKLAIKYNNNSSVVIMNYPPIKSIITQKYDEETVKYLLYNSIKYHDIIAILFQNDLFKKFSQNAINLFFHQVHQFKDFILFFDPSIICENITQNNIDMINEKFDIANNINNIIKYSKDPIIKYIINNFKIDVNIIDQKNIDTINKAFICINAGIKIKPEHTLYLLKNKIWCNTHTPDHISALIENIDDDTCILKWFRDTDRYIVNKLKCIDNLALELEVLLSKKKSNKKYRNQLVEYLSNDDLVPSTFAIIKIINNFYKDKEIITKINNIVSKHKTNYKYSELIDTFILSKKNGRGYELIVDIIKSLDCLKN